MYSQFMMHGQKNIKLQRWSLLFPADTCVSSGRRSKNWYSHLNTNKN